MKLFRKASVCILVAALLCGAFAGEHPARAATPLETACAIITLGVCSVFFSGLDDENAITCRLLSASAGGNATTHAYRYTGRCAFDDGSGILQHFGFQGSGVWDSTSQTAREAFQNLTATGNQHSVWSCPEDPWIAPTVVTCQLQAFNGAGGYLGQPFDSSEPWGALLIQLAFNGPQTLAAALATALQPPPPLPDLTAQLAGSQTASVGQQNLSYTVTIGNRGTRPPKEVTLQVNLPKLLKVQTAKGSVPELNCAIQQDIVVGCGGPVQVEPGKQVQVLFTAAAIGLGSGQLVATVNPSHSVEEADYSNNTSTLALTVNP